MAKNNILTLAAIGGGLSSAAVAILLLDKPEEEAPRRKRRVWVSSWLRKREQEGAFAKLLPELIAGDHNEQKLFASFVRMWKADFDHLLELIGPTIEKQQTVMRQPIRPGARLATGTSFRSLQYLFRIPQCTISTIVPEVLDAIYIVLTPTYLKVNNLVHILFLVKLLTR